MDEITIEKLIAHNGGRVKCLIDNAIIEDGRLTCTTRIVPELGFRHRFFICQNFKDGTSAPDKLGYRYSWVFDDADYKVQGIRDLQLIYE